MNILYQCNDNYAPYCGVSITSLFENNKHIENISVFILSDDMSHENQSKFMLLAEEYGREIMIVDSNPLNKKLEQLGIPMYRGSYSTNFKLFAYELLDCKIERLLYIDSDTVVVGDISELFEINLNNCPVAMAQDSLVINHKEDIGLNKQNPYYNAGVILFDMCEWKKQQCSDKIIEHVKTVRAHYPAPDQDLLNVVFKNRIFQLLPEYNMEPAYYMFSFKNYYKTFKNPCFYSRDILEREKNNPKIIHFFRVMGEFPWHKNNMHPFNDLFDKYLAISPWFDYEKKDSNISWVFRIEKMLYKALPECIFIRLFHLSHIYFMKKSDKLSLKNKNNKYM